MSVISLNIPHIKFTDVIDFQEDFKRLSKTYRNLPDDFKRYQNILQTVPGRIEKAEKLQLGNNIEIPIFKDKEFRSQDFKGKGHQSGFRNIYAYKKINEKQCEIIFIEIYHKLEKDNNDSKRIEFYFNGN